MSVKKIEIRPKGDGTYSDILYPKTSVDMVDGAVSDSEFTTHKAEDATAAHLGKNIGVEDVSSHFTATTVEGVLNELFTFADNGKTNIAFVVGYPATASGTFSQLQAVIQNAKNDMATNLTNKGTSAVESETLQVLADKIANVSTGIKFAEGSLSTSTPYGQSKIYTVNGLDFIPKTIIVVNDNYNTAISYGIADSGTVINPAVSPSRNHMIQISNPTYGSFDIGIVADSGYSYDFIAEWMAYE